jgi:hypothetical protein
MGYMHINNLYKDQTILLFRECYAMEKVHGTSAHIYYHDRKVTFFSGGAPHPEFMALFNINQLEQDMFLRFGDMTVTIYGEAYGGKMQSMKETYGDKLKFVAFEVEINDKFVHVPVAEQICIGLGLDFVDYARVGTTLDELDAERDKPSTIALRLGLGEKQREGVVLRPLEEMTLNNGARVICKHKRPDFCETRTQREVRVEDMEVLREATAIAEEWVTANRLDHVLDKLGVCTIEQTGTVIKAMLEDVIREGAGEIVMSKEASTAISHKTKQLFHGRL